MNIRRHMLSTFAGLALLLLAASAAQAQATRTWVSGVGNDVDPCSRTAPCKTYAGALIKTAAGGEISTNKSIMIEGTKGQGYGSMLASGTTGVIVNDSLTGTPNTIVVTLRNLSINGAGPTLGSNGIRFVSGKALHVEDCQIINFRTGTGRGISVELTANASQIMTVKDTLSKNVRAKASGSRTRPSAGPSTPQSTTPASTAATSACSATPPRSRTYATPSSASTRRRASGSPTGGRASTSKTPSSKAAPATA